MFKRDSKKSGAVLAAWDYTSQHAWARRGGGGFEEDRIKDKGGRVIKEIKKKHKKSSVLILPPTGVADWDPERLSPMVGRKGGAGARGKEQQIKQRWIMSTQEKKKKIKRKKVVGSWESDIAWWERILALHIKNKGKAQAL